MRVLIINGSFRRGGNTDTLLIPFTAELEALGVQVTTLALRDMTIGNCEACWACQYVPDTYGCAKKDDMYIVVDGILSSDCFILATPIYSWYCTPPMKSMMDRHYGLNKYYGNTRRHSLWHGKKCGIVATCGYPPDYGAGPFEDGVKRLCVHSELEYIGRLAVRDTDDRASFETEEAVLAAGSFAREVYDKCGGTRNHDNVAKEG